MHSFTSGSQRTPSDADREPVRTVLDVGEDALVQDVIGRYPAGPWLSVGPGDDAAVLDLAAHFPGPVVVSTDTLVERMDFRLDWSSGFDVGVKTVAQNFADLAAMGARPHTLLVSLTAPPDLPTQWVGDLADGIAAECGRAGAVVAGGDLSGGTEISITATVLGALADGRPVLRSGARVGDVVAVAGRLGRSAAGLALLSAGYGVLTSTSPATSPTSAPSALKPDPSSPRPDRSALASDLSSPRPVPSSLSGLLDDHRRPQPPYEAGPRAAVAGATAMIDTSDGLIRDAQRLARASGVLVDLDPTRLRPDSDLRAAAELLGEPDPGQWVLTGGEDHALLATFDPGSPLPEGFRPIGLVASGTPAVTLAGRPVTGPGGWHHFT
jgi:thiamine-monophosphate kinase